MDIVRKKVDTGCGVTVGTSMDGRGSFVATRCSGEANGGNLVHDKCIGFKRSDAERIFNVMVADMKAQKLLCTGEDK